MQTPTQQQADGLDGGERVHDRHLPARGGAHLDIEATNCDGFAILTDLCKRWIDLAADILGVDRIHRSPSILEICKNRLEEQLDNPFLRRREPTLRRELQVGPAATAKKAVHSAVNDRRLDGDQPIAAQGQEPHDVDVAGRWQALHIRAERHDVERHHSHFHRLPKQRQQTATQLPCESIVDHLEGRQLRARSSVVGDQAVGLHRTGSRRRSGRLDVAALHRFDQRRDFVLRQHLTRL